jgi:hypothetical protein
MGLFTFVVTFCPSNPGGGIVLASRECVERRLGICGKKTKQTTPSDLRRPSLTGVARRPEGEMTNVR